MNQQNMPPSNHLTQEMTHSIKSEASVYNLQNVFAGSQHKALKMLEPLLGNANTSPIATAMSEKWQYLHNYRGTPEEYNKISADTAKLLCKMVDARLEIINGTIIENGIRNSDRTTLIQAWSSLNYLGNLITKKSTPTLKLKNAITLALLGIRDSFVCTDCNGIFHISHTDINTGSVCLCKNCSQKVRPTAMLTDRPQGQIQRPVNPSRRKQPPVTPTQQVLTEEDMAMLRSMSARFMPENDTPLTHRHLLEMASAITKADVIKLVMDSTWSKLEKYYFNEKENYNNISQETYLEVAQKMEKYLSSLKEKYIIKGICEANFETRLKAWLALDFYTSRITDGGNKALIKCRTRLGIAIIKSMGPAAKPTKKYKPQMEADLLRKNVSHARDKDAPIPTLPPHKRTAQECTYAGEPDVDRYYVKIKSRISEDLWYLRKCNTGWRIYYASVNCAPGSDRVPDIMFNQDDCNEEKIESIFSNNDSRYVTMADTESDKLISDAEAAYIFNALPLHHPEDEPYGRLTVNVNISMYGGELVSACYWKNDKLIPCAQQPYINNLINALADVAQQGVVVKE